MQERIARMKDSVVITKKNRLTIINLFSGIIYSLSTWFQMCSLRQAVLEKQCNSSLQYRLLILYQTPI